MCILYCVFKKKSFVATSQAPFRSTFDRSRLLGDIDNLVNLFCNRFDMAVQRATQRTSGLLVSMLDVVDPLQAAKGLTFGHPIFTVLCLDKSSVYFCFPLSTWMSISIHIRLFTAATDLLPIRGPGNHGYSDYSSFSCISCLKYIRPKK